MENNTSQPQITITDLVTIKDLIDLSCTRGAFRAAEMTSVGEVYDKLNSFLSSVLASAQPEADTTGDEK
jgi:hypothetical protein